MVALDNMNAGQFLADRLVGKPLWMAVGGKGTGSVIHLGFGGATLMSMPIRNPNLTELEQTHWPEISLMIDCCWRIMYSSRLLASWRDSNEKGGPMLRGLYSLRGLVVQRVEVTKGVADLCIDFDRDYRLSVTPDIRDPEECELNYDLSFSDARIHCVNDGSLLLLPKE